MIIVALEALDKGGKHTQKQKLAERLRADGLKVAEDEFHRYDTPTGHLIHEWLYNRYDVDQKTIELIMAADKQAQQKRFFELEAEGHDVLILDRYIGSQFAYGTISNKKADPDMGTYEIESWLRNLLRYVRKPDATILIDLPAEESMRRKGKHGENDRYEADLELLNGVREQYHFYLENTLHMRERIKIDGMQSIEEISDEIYEYVKYLMQENLV